MCQQQHLIASRRGVLGFAGSALAFSALPGAALASGSIEALGFTCIDYRFVDEEAAFFHKQKLTNEYDILALAGASLGAVSSSFPSSNAAFWDQLAISRKLHNIKKVVVVDHRDCGAYKVAFGKDFAPSGAPEAAQHRSVMLKLQAELAKKHPGLAAEYYLMALDGSAERLL